MSVVHCQAEVSCEVCLCCMSSVCFLCLCRINTFKVLIWKLKVACEGLYWILKYVALPPGSLQVLGTSLFHGGRSPLNWYWVVCMGDLLHRCIQIKCTNMFSMWLQSGVPTSNHFHWRIIAVLTQNPVIITQLIWITWTLLSEKGH